MSACENKLDEISSCFVCRKILEGKGSGKCSKCKLISYCSIEHQKLHWENSHRQICQGEGKLDVLGYTPDAHNMYRFFGFCLDCLDRGKITYGSYYCDGCHRGGVICRHCECTGSNSSLCKICRNCKHEGGDKCSFCRN